MHVFVLVMVRRLKSELTQTTTKTREVADYTPKHLAGKNIAIAFRA